MSSHENRDQAASWAQRLRARQRGDLPISREFGSTLALIGGFALLSMLVHDGWNGLMELAKEQWRWSNGTAQQPLELLGRAGSSLGRPLVLVGGALFLLAFGVGWIQTGCGLFWSRLQFDPGRLSPARNWQQAISRGQLLSSLLGMARWLTMWIAMFVCLWSARDSIVAVGATHGERWLPTAASVVQSITIKMVGILALLALFDYVIQWWWYERRIAMSPDEMRQDLQASQIDPYVTQRRWTLGQSFVQNGIIRLVRSSDVLLTDETGAVVGLSWSGREGGIPRVAMRAGAIQAESTKQIAAQFGIPVKVHSVASSLFARCRTDDDVPKDIMETVRALGLGDRRSNRMN